MVTDSREEEEDMRHLLVDADEMVDLQELQNICEKHSNALQQSMRILTDEYEVESSEMERELKTIGVDIDNLPADLSQLLNTLADCAMALNSVNAHPSTLALNDADLLVELAHCDLQYTQLANKLSLVERKKNAAASRMALLEKHLQHYESSKDSISRKVFTWAENVEMLKRKQSDYNYRLSNEKENSVTASVEQDNLLLSDIKAVKQENETLRAHLSELEQELQVFQSLPAVRPLTRLLSHLQLLLIIRFPSC